MNYAADTSFLIGLFVDEPRSRIAQKTFSRLKSGREKVFVPAQAIVEAVYVLEKFYRLDREKVAEYITSILGTYIFIVEKYELFYRVMDSYRKHPEINIGDIIIAEEARKQQISNILTFDSHFGKLGLSVVESP